MKRIALTVMCLVVLIAGVALAEEATIPLSWANANEIQGLLTGELPEWQVRALGGAIELPDGVERTEAVMERNAIRVVGTEAGIAQLREMLKALDHPSPQIEVATTWINVHDPSLLPQALATDKVFAPKIALLTRMSTEEIAALKNAGTVLSEPRILMRNGFPGAIGFEGDPEVHRSLGGVAQSNQDGTISLQISIHDMDRRPEAEQKDVSLQVMVRVADGETILLARVGEDGAILNPVYLLTARVVQQ